ncbi:replication-associated protein [Sewage-associated circular DNA virus-29]|uniref:Replication-associated protein n=1 Tax=Sewage-associated circular DNA virus-29 TaxID=1592096 RepID=A0A0B4UGZ5_9VIRU|nr:replication-associated protein [Sewage-associated circular DNA virus-29]AJD07553.1 replication-associated protein [Sewage-associated circular DNA virus-29]
MSTTQTPSILKGGLARRKAGTNPKANRWCYTLNNPEFPIPWNETTQLYHIYGKEIAPGTGTPHHQGFICFKNQKYLTQVKELNDKAHWEIAKGTNQQASDYCKKEGDFIEKGTLPEDPQRLGAKANEVKWRLINDLAKAGNLAEIDIKYPKVWNTSYRNLKSIKVDHMKPLADLDEPCGVWLYGASGAGKTMKARTDYPNAYLKLPNKWWDGYQGEANVIIDDVDPNHAYMGYHLKIWADRYSHLAEVKGSTIVVRPRKLVITSQYRIKDIWASEPATMSALLRRFKEVYVDRKLWDNPIENAFKKQNAIAQVKINEAVAQIDKESTPEIPVEVISDDECTMLDALVAEAEEEAQKNKLKDKPTIGAKTEALKRCKAMSVEDYEKMKPIKLRPTNPHFPDPPLVFATPKRPSVIVKSPPSNRFIKNRRKSIVNRIKGKAQQAKYRYSRTTSSGEEESSDDMKESPDSMEDEDNSVPTNSDEDSDIQDIEPDSLVCSEELSQEDSMETMEVLDIGDSDPEEDISSDEY